MREILTRIMVATGILVWVIGIFLASAAVYGHWSHTRYWRSRVGLARLNELRTRWAGNRKD